jgi:integrase
LSDVLFDALRKLLRRNALGLANDMRVVVHGDADVVPFSEQEVEKVLKACEAYGGQNRERLIVLTKLMLTTGLAIGDASIARPVRR